MEQRSYVLVDTSEKFKSMIQEIHSNEIISFDTETDGLNTRISRVIGFSISTKPNSGYYLPILVYDKETFSLKSSLIPGSVNPNMVTGEALAKYAIKILVDKKLVGHNLAFDVKIVKNNLGIDLTNSIWVDTILLAHTLDEDGPGFQFGKPFGLKEIATSIQDKIGFDSEKAANEELVLLKESIKKNGGSVTTENYEIWKADLDILSNYAIGDTDLSLRLCNYYLPKLEEEGLTKFFFEDEVMPLYKEVTIPMEEAGVALDMELLKKSYEEITQKMEEISKKVLSDLLSIPQVKDWVVETALEKFPPVNSGKYAQKLCKYYEDGATLLSADGKKYTINKSTLTRLPPSPIRDFLITGEIGCLDKKLGLKVSMELWKESNGDYININSKDQLAKIVFDAMGFSVEKYTPKGRPKFDDDIIDALSDTFEWAKTLKSYNRLLKIKSTYIERFLESQESGVYYPYYKQFATISGRYGSDMQQLPRPVDPAESDDHPDVIYYNNLIRAFFIPRPGSIFIDCDYESLEPHVFAHVSGDEGLKDIFRNNWDFYSTIAIKTEGLNQYSPDKKNENFLRAKAPHVRNKAKAYALGIPYGMGAFALGKNLNVSIQTAQKLVNGYLDGFPELKKWMENSKKMAKTQGMVKTQVGRIRHLKKVKEIYENIQDNILDYKFRKTLEREFGVDKITRVYRDYKNGLNNSLNFQIQSLAASIVNRAAIAINRKFKELKINGMVVGQIHDQLVIEVEESRKEEAAKIVKDCMENTTKLSIDLKAPPAFAHNLRDGH